MSEKTKPRVQLIGLDGNAFAILSRVTTALRKAGLRDQIDEFLQEARSSDYDHLLTTAMEYVEVY